MSSQFGGFGLGYVPTDIMSEGHPYRRLGLAMAARHQADERYRQNASRAPLPQLGGDVQKMPAPDFSLRAAPSSPQIGLSLTPSQMQDAAEDWQNYWAKPSNANSPSLWERMQGGGADLGSRLPGSGAANEPLGTYSLAGLLRGSTPSGGGY